MGCACQLVIKENDNDDDDKHKKNKKKQNVTFRVVSNHVLTKWCYNVHKLKWKKNSNKLM